MSQTHGVCNNVLFRNVSTKIKWNTCCQKVGFHYVGVSRDNMKERVFSWFPDRCDGLKQAGGVGQLLYSDDLRVWTEARPTTTHSAPSESSVQSGTEREHQLSDQQLLGRLTTCVLCLCDTLLMTNKQNEAEHCRKELECFAEHKTWLSAGRWTRLVNACCEGSPFVKLWLRIVLTLCLWAGVNLATAPLTAATWVMTHGNGNCIRAAFGSGGLQNHFHHLFTIFGEAGAGWCPLVLPGHMIYRISFDSKCSKARNRLRLSCISLCTSVICDKKERKKNTLFHLTL